MDIITIAYKKRSGEIIAYHIGEEKDFIQLLADDKELLFEHSLKDTSSVDTIIKEVDLQTFSPSEYYIDKKEITPLCSIELSTNALDDKNPNGIPEIKGDGTSQCEITASVLKTDGSVNKHFSGQITINTARGRLSARNGILQAKEGMAKVTLTSVAETAPPFVIKAEAQGCKPGILKMEFY